MICTGVSAFWCPVCGDCTCERAHDGECCFDGQDCPLHGPGSKHADTITLKECERRIDALALDCEVTLTPHDRDVVSRFAQLLFDRSRREKGGRDEG